MKKANFISAFILLLICCTIIVKAESTATEMSCNCNSVIQGAISFLESLLDKTDQGGIEKGGIEKGETDEGEGSNEGEGDGGSSDPGASAETAVESCKKLKEINPNLPSGQYWINPSAPIQVFCEMTLSFGGIQGGWMRVADLDMTRPEDQCPEELKRRIVAYGDSSKRLCERRVSIGCSSVMYSSDIRYSRVSGKIIGYQYGWPYAFYRSDRGIDAEYVFGVSITHGPSGGREHIWTFAAAIDDAEGFESRKCSCSNSANNPSASPTPSFIGNDYFCDSAIHQSFYNEYLTEDQVLTSDPLWDGQGCPSTSTCCDFPGGNVKPPLFYKELSASTTDDIEVRLCTPHGLKGTTPLEKIELYVQ